MAQRVTSESLVGREAELAALEAALERSATGCGQLAFVAGESGVGKSRLMSEFAALARARGARILSGDCVELGDGELPYAAIVSALRPLVRHGDPALDDLGPARGELAALLPELGATEGLQVDPVEGTAQSRLFELLLGVLERLGREAPVALLIEDIHWADSSTRNFLHYLGRTLCSERVFIVATYRSDELHRRHPLRPLLAELELAEGSQRIALERLGRDELALQIADILGHRPADELVDRLWERTGGNPLLAEELLAAGPDGGGPLPPTLRDALMVRVEALGDDTQRVLRWAAAAQRIEHDVLADVCGLDDAALATALREAIDHHVLVVDAGGAYAFRHALLREAVHDDLLPGEHAQLHRALAGALEGQCAKDPSSGRLQAAAVAHHYDAAGDQPRALTSALRAAEAARSMYADAEAAALYARALELWENVSDAEELTGIDHIELLVRSAEALMEVESSRAEPLFRQALAEHDGEDTARTAHLLVRRGAALWYMGRGHEALDSYQEALEALPEGAEGRLRARIFSSRAKAAMLAGRFSDGRELAEEALVWARAAGAHDLESTAHNTMGVCEFSLGRSDAGERSLREAMRIAREHNMPPELTRAHINLSDSLHLDGRSQEAYEVARDGLDAAHRFGQRGVWMTLQLIEIAHAQGRHDEAYGLLRQLSRPRGRVMATVFFDVVAASLELASGEHDAVIARLEDTRETAAASLEPQFIAGITTSLAEAHRRAGRLDEALAAAEWGLRRLNDPAGRVEEVVGFGRLCGTATAVLADRAVVARHLGRAREEAEAVRRVEALAGELRARYDRAKPTVAEAQAWCATATAEAARGTGSEDAADAWSEAAAAWEDLARPALEAHALWRAAEELAGGGDRAAAGDVAGRALTLAECSGAAWLAEEVRRLARQARLTLGDGDEPASPAPPDPSAELGLTDREREVLALVAQGATNREIGETLYMAEKTASVHVSRILAKLGVRSRTQAAAVAHRLGLDNPGVRA